MSPRTGRPKAKNPVNQQISVRFDADTMEKLKAYSKKKGITLGEAVREAVRLLVGRKKE